MNYFASTFLPVCTSVPQVLTRCNLDCVLNTCLTLLQTKCHLFADTVQIYISSSITDLATIVELLNYDLIRIKRWTSINYLLLKPSKSQSIILF